VRCKTCHYSLEGLSGPRHLCPECGTPFDPNDSRTLDTERPKGMIAWIAFVVAFVLSIALIVFLWRFFSGDFLI
jgi:hypothetical protein